MTLRPAMVDPSVPDVVPARIKSGSAKTFSSIYSGFEEHRQPKAAKPEQREKSTESSQDAVVVPVSSNTPPPVRLERSFGLSEIIQDSDGPNVDQSGSIPSPEQLHPLSSRVSQPAEPVKPQSTLTSKVRQASGDTQSGAQEILQGEPITVQSQFTLAPDCLPLLDSTQDLKQAVLLPDSLSVSEASPRSAAQSTTPPGSDNQVGTQGSQQPVIALDSLPSTEEQPHPGLPQSAKQPDESLSRAQGLQQPIIALNSVPLAEEQLHPGLPQRTRQPNDNLGLQEPRQLSDSLPSAAEQRHPLLQSTKQPGDDNRGASQEPQQAVARLDSLPSPNPKEQIEFQSDAVKLHPGDTCASKNSESTRLVKTGEETARRPETAFAVRLTDASPVIVATPSAINQSTADAAPKSTPAAATPEVLAEPTKPAESKAVNEVSFRVNGADDASAVIRVVERSGAIHVSVHAAEPELTASLRANVNELKERLETDGRQAEIWKPPSGTEDASQHRRRGQRFDWIDALEKSA